VPKLAELVEEGMLDGPLIHKRAIDWDVETLSEEQHLVQRLYDALSESDLQDLHDIAELGLVALIGDTFTLQLWVPKEPYNKANRGSVIIRECRVFAVDPTQNASEDGVCPSTSFSEVGL